MKKAILGRKLRMTQIFMEDGKRIPLTAIEIGPCPIVQIKTKKNDGYEALQIGYWPKKEKRVLKPEAGHFKKANAEPTRHLREIRLDSIEGYELGQTLDASIFEDGDVVDVTGLSKGCGFQGGMKRHNWSGGRATHGSMFHRRIGSIAPGTGLSRVVLGKTLPGHMGNKNVTLQNLKVIKVDAENNLLYVKGGIPGPNGSVVFIKNASKTQIK